MLTHPNRNPRRESRLLGKGLQVPSIAGERWATYCLFLRLLPEFPSLLMRVLSAPALIMMLRLRVVHFIIPCFRTSESPK
jgi:hypothetical protein